ncbi:MAG: FAD-dependent oxidoreductase [Actinomycetota bacterium]|nr:FAD-dependent oxidoreductase [Actinomycetota bacterium]
MAPGSPDPGGLVIVGGSDAGIMAGLWAHRTDPTLPITVLVRDEYPNFSICGLPFYLSGETPRWEMLAHRTTSDLRDAGLDVRTGHEVTAIDPGGHTVEVTAGGRARRLAYDRLVIGTGATPVRPPLEGVDEPGVHLLHTVDEARDLRRVLDGGARRAALVGAGYIGTELADALTRRGMTVELLEMAPEVLPTFAPGMGAHVRATLERHGVAVHTATRVERLERRGDGFRVVTDRGETEVDVVVVAVGVRPEVGLLARAGATTGIRGAAVVDRAMRTGLADVFAAGDCVHTHHQLLAEPTYLPLGTTAHKQGRVAGINAAGGDATYAGSLGTQAVKVFDLVAARTGLDDREAGAAGWRPRTVAITMDDHKAYYPGATPMHVQVTGDVATGRLLGAQIVGAHGAEVSKRIDIVAAAIHAEATVDTLYDLDLSYTPPLSSPWDPVQVAAQEWVAATARTPMAAASG